MLQNYARNERWHRMKPYTIIPLIHISHCTHIFLHFFFPEWTLAIAITGNKFQEISTIYKSHANYLSNFVRHRCRVFRPRISSKMWRARHTVPPLELIPFRRILRNYREFQKMCSIGPVIWSNTRGIGNSGRMRKVGNRSRVQDSFNPLFEFTRRDDGKNVNWYWRIKGKIKGAFFSSEVILTLA